MFEISNYYYRFPDELANRLDFAFYHPIFNKIIRFKHNFTYPLHRIGEYFTGEWTGENLEERDSREKKYLYVKVENVIDNKIIITEDTEFLSEHELQKLSNSIPKPDSILVTRVASFGRCAVVDRDFKGAISDNILCFELDKRVEPLFISRFINSTLGQVQIKRTVAGMGRGVLTYDRVGDLCIGIPPSKSEQKRILKRVELIESQAIEFENEAKKIKEKEEAILLEELGIEIPKEETSNYFFKTGAEKGTLCFSVLPSDVADRVNYLFYHPKLIFLEKLCEKYSIEELENACTEPIQRGEQPEYTEDGEVVVIKTVDLKNSYIDYENCLKVSKVFFEHVPSAHAKKGDILVASTGYVSMGKTDVYDRDEPAMIDGHISVLRLKDEYDPYFVTYFLRSHFGRLQFEKWFSGSSGQIELQPKNLNKFILPQSSKGGIPLERQKEISKKITRALDRFFQLKLKAKEKWKEAQETFENLILK